MPNTVISVLVTTDEPIPGGEQGQRMLTRIENAIIDTCKEYGIDEPSMCLAQFEDWTERG